MANNEQCANAKMGYDIKTSRPYYIKNPCPHKARKGHIFCEKCRLELGGFKR